MKFSNKIPVIMMTVVVIAFFVSVLLMSGTSISIIGFLKIFGVGIAVLIIGIVVILILRKLEKYSQSSDTVEKYYIFYSSIATLCFSVVLSWLPFGLNLPYIMPVDVFYRMIGFQLENMITPGDGFGVSLNLSGYILAIPIWIVSGGLIGYFIYKVKKIIALKTSSPLSAMGAGSLFVLFLIQYLIGFFLFFYFFREI